MILISPHLWYILLVLIAFTTGITMTGFAHYLGQYFTENMRVRAVADVLIIGNVFLTLAHICSVITTPMLSFLFIELVFAIMLKILIGIKVEDRVEQSRTQTHTLSAYTFIFIFILVITLNSGIMFSVIYPYFGVFEMLESFYTNAPYILAIFLLSRYFKVHRFYFLYVGLAFWAIALIAYATLGQSILGFFIVFTMMLFAAGIFDFFWWSMIASHFDYLENPATLFGLGLALNVWGVFSGSLLGEKMMSLGFSETGISYVGLSIIILSMLMIFPLNQKLSAIYENNSFLVYLLEMKTEEKVSLVEKAEEVLSRREMDVFKLLIEGKLDRESVSCFICRLIR